MPKQRGEKDHRGEREEKSSYPIGVIAKQMSDVSVTSSFLLSLLPRYLQIMRLDF